MSDTFVGALGLRGMPTHDASELVWRPTSWRQVRLGVLGNGKLNSVRLFDAVCCLL